MAKASKAPQSPQAEVQEVYGAKKNFQEWRVQINNKKIEKLKISREVVKITEEQAQILNEGVENGQNTYGFMYFLPE